MSFPKEQVEALWAPWRVEYFSLERPLGDFFTEAAQTSDDPAHLVILRRKSGFLIMNRYPYSVGHLMAVPYRKVADLGELTAEEKLECGRWPKKRKSSCARWFTPRGSTSG